MWYYQRKSTSKFDAYFQSKILVWKNIICAQSSLYIPRFHIYVDQKYLKILTVANKYYLVRSTMVVSVL